MAILTRRLSATVAPALTARRLRIRPLQLYFGWGFPEGGRPGGPAMKEPRRKHVERTHPGPRQAAPRQASRLAPVLAAGLLVLMTAAAYWPASRCGYIWDDDEYFRLNPAVHAADGLGRIWFDVKATPQYYPLVFTTFWVEYRMWGLDPAGYHLVNIALHALGSVLLWRVLRLLEIPAAWAAAAVFALHPVHVESVAWITERKNVLSGVFYFGSAWAYFRSVPGLNRAILPGRRRWYYALSLALLAFALLSKTAACTLPVVLLLVLWWKRNGKLSRADVLGLVPFFAVSLTFAPLTIWMEKLHVQMGGETWWTLSRLQRVLLAGRAVCFYAGKLVWPAQQVFIYPRWHIDPRVWWQYLYPGAVIGAVVVLWFARRRLGLGPLAAILCFVGGLFPVLGFFDVYFMWFSFVNDHFQYLPSVAITTLVTASVWRAAERFGAAGRKAAAGALALVLVVLGTLTWRQTHSYRDLETLWRDTLQKNPDAWMAHNNLGGLLADQGKTEEAIAHYEHALALRPEDPLAHHNLAVILQQKGENARAISHYCQALQGRPDLAETENNLGALYQVQGDMEEAITHFRKAVKLNPGMSEARGNLNNLLRALGRPEEPR
jgi:tetratricopeptide (TPR) repeat protein